MIDIHSHIIYDVDDGPDTVEESLALIKMSYEQGVRQIVATSHRRKGMFEVTEEVIFKNFQRLKILVENDYPDLQLHYGGELYYTDDILQRLSDKKVPTMAETRFALVEFSMTTPWREIHTAISRILMLGITPIIAHIERYNALEFDMKKVEELINMGCYTQINSVHVLKAKLIGDKEKIFKKRARYFLDKDLVHMVASDMHNTEIRRPYMTEAYGIVKKVYGSNRAKLLFETNALTLLKNQYI